MLSQYLQSLQISCTDNSLSALKPIIIIAAVLIAILLVGVIYAYIKNRSAEPNDKVIIQPRPGDTVKVVKAVNLYGGQVVDGDIFWNAKTIEDVTIPEETWVEILEIDGSTLIVKEL